MKKYLIYLMMAAAVMAFGACSPEDENEPQTPEIENPEKPDDGGEDTPDVVPYPTEYTPCTEVAREEKDNNARPAIVSKVENWADYDTVFIGCPVWWWTTPMIICTFAESYDFKGKTVVPFCTYAATYRDETLARIVELTPDAEHLTGEGLTSGRINEQNISSWLKEIGLIE